MSSHYLMELTVYSVALNAFIDFLVTASGVFLGMALASLTEKRLKQNQLRESKRILFEEFADLRDRIEQEMRQMQERREWTLGAALQDWVHCPTLDYIFSSGRLWSLQTQDYFSDLMRLDILLKTLKRKLGRDVWREESAVGSGERAAIESIAQEILKLLKEKHIDKHLQEYG